MDSNYLASETSQSPGIGGMLSTDVAPAPTYENTMIPPIQGPPAPSPTGFNGVDYAAQMPDKLSSALAGLGSFGQQLAASQEPEPPPIGQITRKADGTTDLKGVSSAFLEDVMGQMNDLKTMKQAAMARVYQLKQQEASGPPLLDALSKFSGNMAANDPNMPGWVRALGMTNLQMGPEGIKQQRMAEENRALQFGQAEAGVGEKLMDYAAQQEYRQQQLQMASLKQREIVQTNWEQARTRLESTAKEGILPDKDEFVREAINIGKTLPEIEQAWKNGQTLADNYTKQQLEKDKRATDKAVATAQATAPIKIDLHEKEKQIDTVEAKKLIEARAEAQKGLIGTRYEAMNNRYLTRLDANRLQELAKVPPAERMHLSALDSMGQFLDRMEAFIGPGGKLQGTTGPIQGFLTQKLPSSLSGSERQLATHLFGVEKKRVIDFANAGVRGWAPGEDAIKKLGLIETLTPKAAAGVMAEIRHQINITRNSDIDAFPYAPWDMTPELLGGVNSDAYKRAAPKSREYFDAIAGVAQRSDARQGVAPLGTAGGKKYPWEK